jgi:PAS domain-containing protein
VSDSFFAPRIADTQRRAKLIAEHAEGQSMRESRYVAAAIEELNVTLEELRVADEELRQQNAELEAACERATTEHDRYRAIFEFAPVGLLVTDVNGACREANRAASVLLGCDRQFLVGKPVPALLDDPSREALRAALVRTAGAGERITCDARTARGGVPLRFTIQADGPGGGPVRVVRWAVQPTPAPPAAAGAEPPLPGAA